jgi:hypothetical protein
MGINGFYISFYYPYPYFKYTFDCRTMCFPTTIADPAGKWREGKPWQVEEGENQLTNTV